VIFNTHSGLVGRHAFLSPSNYHWLNYDETKLEARFIAAMAAQRGTDLHKLAHESIRLGVKLDSRSNKALAAYVNDAIGYKMRCEQTLYYSDNCFGHADTICFRRLLLRIHDLKTGLNSTSEKQLEVYAALFCLEYGVDPFTIRTLLRIYQRDEVREYEPLPEHIAFIMQKIVDFDVFIESIKEGR
jgi:hypothetical protein